MEFSGFKFKSTTKRMITLLAVFTIIFSIIGSVNPAQASASILNVTGMPVGSITPVNNGGTGYYGDGCPVINAKFSSPAKITFDSAGNLFIADVANNRLRVVVAVSGTQYGISMQAGYIYTIAGNGTNGSDGDGGLATSAQVRPGSIAFDRAGNFYVSGSYRIRKIDTSGIITTVAGTGTNGHTGDDGPATDAQIGSGSIAFDRVGNLYLCEAMNNYVRRIDTNGIITTIAGTGSGGYSGDGGPAINAQIYNAHDIACDSVGNLYIADYLNNCVRRIDNSGIITTVAGIGATGNDAGGYSGDGGPATSARLKSPRGVALDSAGNLYIAENGHVRKVDTGGTITTFADKTTPVYGTLNFPIGNFSPQKLAFDGDGNLYINDGSYARIFHMQLSQAPTLASLTLSGSPDLTYSGTPLTFDLNSLILTGTDQNGDAFDLTGQSVTWAVYSGLATVSDSTLTINGSGTIGVTASVYGVTSNPFSFTAADNGQTPGETVSVVSAGTDSLGKKITMNFDLPMADPTGKQDQFLVKIDGVDSPVAAVSPGDNPNQIILTLLYQIPYWGYSSETPQVITLNYTMGDVAAADGTLLPSFTGVAVANNRLAIELRDYEPDATEIACDDDGAGGKIFKYRLDNLVDYDDVNLALYFSNGFFRNFEDNMANYVKFYEKDTGAEVQLPNVVTVGIQDNGTLPYVDGVRYMEITDWYFKQISGRAPLGLALKSTALKPSTTYVVEVQKGFSFHIGPINNAYIFEFTTTADSQTKPYWADDSSLTASGLTDSGLTLEWPAAQDNHGVDYNNLHYNIYQNGTLLTSVDGETTSYSVTNLTPATEYQFKVEAVDFANNLSTNCLETTITTTASGGGGVTTAPTWPKGSSLTATNVTQNDLTLTWSYATDDVAVTNYKIYQDGSVIDTVYGTTATYNVNGLNPGVTYAFKVEAGDADDNWSTDGPTVSVTTAVYGDPDTTAPIWPDGAILNASGITQTGLTLTWSYATDDVAVTNYKIYQDGSVIDTVYGTTTTYNITGLDPGTNYTFKVEAGDAAGHWSSDGPTVDATTTARGGDGTTGIYTVTPAVDSTYANGKTADGIDTMTVNSGITGLKYFNVSISPVTDHPGNEKAVFVLLRNGMQISLDTTEEDFDTVHTARAGFNVQPGDVVKVYIVDDLTNDTNFNPTILQQ
ncbi:Chitodextrinase [Desulfotomaculum arcticum]|uniref:Chitodextrinase n=1 Tax=Desulfotruncus arcticus DSM 17038 TaxID=1121424 RepID=A0A1I2XC36_9FIRM|nr:fibronectin type III domain-containing protein [Desulfotruncus arcticus]SFH10246.1 Chitodextrinase [Desulfotomaculum arcticum] [Desulfotruncus arcticus DSM 17038]